MNYRELLKKYIRLVGEEEGISFINPDPKWRRGEDYINDEEFKELLLLDREVYEEECKQYGL